MFGDGVLSIANPTDEERRQAETRASESSRRSWLLGRIGVRLAIANYTHRDPVAIRIDVAPNGKPFLADDCGLFFNISHSGQTVAAAIAALPVGFDVEVTGRVRDVRGIANRFFHPDEARAISESSAGRESLFLRMWTAKESMLKLSGDGLAGGLEKARIRSDETGTLDGRQVFLRNFPLANGIGTVASHSPIKITRNQSI